MPDIAADNRGCNPVLTYGHYISDTCLISLLMTEAVNPPLETRTAGPLGKQREEKENYAG
jgi:hypothetical protein